MNYNIIILPAAQRRLDRYVQYTKEVLKNPIAAKGIINDARKTKKKLSENAGMYQLCVETELAELGYRKIRFENHDFSMIYRIDGEIVYVDGMFHDLQDHESILLNERGNF